MLFFKPVEERVESIQLQERRKRPTRPVSAYLFRGRRTQIPPGVDSNYYVDKPPAEAWKHVFLLLCLSMLDAFLSLWLFSFEGIIEGNPILAQILQTGRFWFLGSKLLMTLFAIFILLIHWNFVIAKRTVRVIWLIRTFIAAYSAIVLYEVLLLIDNV